MNACKDCKWWTGESSDEGNIIFKVCNNSKSWSIDIDGFGVFHSEPYGGGKFASGPDFGCIHWDSKTDK